LVAREEANADDDDGGEDKDEAQTEARGEAHFPIVKAPVLGVGASKNESETAWPGAEAFRAKLRAID
jgi:hypothetical protein